MDNAWWISLVGPLILALLFVWKLLPPSLLLFVPTHIRSRFAALSEKAAVIPDKEAIQTLIHQLEALGFVYIGVKLERLPLWASIPPELSFAAPEAKTFATIGNVPGKPVYYFYTPFRDGGIVLTANSGFRNIDRGNFLMKSVAVKRPEDLFEIHRLALQSFEQRGLVPHNDFSQAGRIAATRQFYQSAPSRRMMRWMGFSYLLLFLGGLSVVSFVAAVFIQGRPAPLTASASDRQGALATVAALTEQVKAQEGLILAPSPEDRAAFAAFLSQPDTGLFRLLPREIYDGSVYDTRYLLSVRGGGSYYSFERRSHVYGFKTDIGLSQGELRVGFAGSDTGLFALPGNLPLEALTLDHPAARVLSGAAPDTLSLDDRTRNLRRFQKDPADITLYGSDVPAVVNMSYFLRSVHTSPEAADILVAFRIVRRDTDGSLIIVWKKLRSFAIPADDPNKQR